MKYFNCISFARKKNTLQTRTIHLKKENATVKIRPAIYFNIRIKIPHCQNAWHVTIDETVLYRLQANFIDLRSIWILIPLIETHLYVSGTADNTDGRKCLLRLKWGKGETFRKRISFPMHITSSFLVLRKTSWKYNSINRY